MEFTRHFAIPSLFIVWTISHGGVLAADPASTRVVVVVPGDTVVQPLPVVSEPGVASVSPRPQTEHVLVKGRNWLGLQLYRDGSDGHFAQVFNDLGKINTLEQELH